MTTTKRKKFTFSEGLPEALIRLACFTSGPLMLLFALTILMSLLVTGGVNTDVNQATSFLAVLCTFSLPMMLALAVVPLAVKMGWQKRSAQQLGLAFPKTGSIIACAVMTAGTVIPTIILSRSPELEVSAWTVWLHFFFVAVSEEIILRSVVMDELRFFTKNKWILSLLNGVIFAFVYHSNGDFLPNLLVRVPLGFVLSMVREKSDSVYPAIALHWLYNMCVTAI